MFLATLTLFFIAASGPALLLVQRPGTLVAPGEAAKRIRAEGHLLCLGNSAWT